MLSRCMRLLAQSSSAAAPTIAARPPPGAGGTQQAHLLRRLTVSNLPWTATESELTELFKQVHLSARVKVQRDRITGANRGFATVEFATPEDAAKALEMLSETTFRGRVLRLAKARQNQRPNRTAD
eukprot:TRINITY_DN11522_c0_g1_i1.p1 TRINITY_DN11522_c0_g1~~TRINITY_DN11522_c0_g1_i1.p1  ORF type:complete len:137 (+),score=19.05 TRINITY_DN11522_c0_g1_i1:34-411(+)